MAVRDPEHQVAPRSALRYRPSASSNQAETQPGPFIARRSRLPPDAPSNSWETDLDDDEVSPPRRNRAVAPTPRRGTTSTTRPRLRFHPLFFVGIGLFVMLFGWIAFSTIGSWWQITQDDWHYGRPRTFQVDAVVGHHDAPQNPSHFIAMNLHRHIVIIEIPGGDVSKSVVYSGPVLLGPGQDLTPVTLSFRDVNHDGKLDMVVTVAGSQLVFINANGTFVPKMSALYFTTRAARYASRRDFESSWKTSYHLSWLVSGSGFSHILA